MNSNSDELATTEYLVGKGADIGAKQHNGQTPLHCSSIHGE